jgi:hypothetical protein
MLKINNLDSAKQILHYTTVKSLIVLAQEANGQSNYGRILRS